MRFGLPVFFIVMCFNQAIAYGSDPEKTFEQVYPDCAYSYSEGCHLARIGWRLDQARHKYEMRKKRCIVVDPLTKEEFDLCYGLD